MAGQQLPHGRVLALAEERSRMYDAHMKTVSYADTDSLTSGWCSDVSNLSEETAQSLQIGGQRRKKYGPRPRVPGSSDPSFHSELSNASPREPPIGSPSSDHLVSPVKEKAALPTLEEEDSAIDCRSSQPRKRPTPMATLGIPSLASRNGSVAYDSLSNYSSSSWQTDASDSMSLTSGASGDYADSCSETSSLRLAPTPSSSYAMTRHPIQRHRPKPGDMCLEVPRPKHPRHRRLSPEQFAEELIQRLLPIASAQAAEEVNEEAMRSLVETTDRADDSPSPESRGINSAGGTLPRPTKAVQAKQVSEHNEVDKQSSSSRGGYLQESSEGYERTNELLKLAPTATHTQPIAPEALHRRSNAQAVQPRDPNGSFPGDGESVASFGQNSRQKRILDPNVEQQLKGSIQMMMRTRPQTKQTHPPRAAHRHRPTGGGGGYRKDSEHVGIDHPHVVHEHRHIHEHYFSGHAPEGITISPRQTTEDSQRMSWHHEYSVSRDHCSGHEKTSEQAVYRVTEKFSHGRERQTGGIDTSRRQRHPSEGNHHEGTTTILFVMENHRNPFKLNVVGTGLTLGDFKREVHLDSTYEYRYFFKRADAESETGVVLEKIHNDNDVLPLFKGRIISRIQRVC